MTAYRLDTDDGTLTTVQTVSTVEESEVTPHEGWSCSQIQICPSGACLFAPTRGHDTIATFAIDPLTGLLTPSGRVPAPASPRGVGIAPDGRFLYAAGNQSANLWVYSVDESAGGRLQLVHEYELEGGRSSSWVLPIDLP